MFRKVSKNASIPFLTLLLLLPLPLVILGIIMELLLPPWWRDDRGGKVAPSMELARLTFEGLTRHDLDLGGGV